MHLLLCAMFTYRTCSHYCNFLLNSRGQLCILSRAVCTLPIIWGVLHIETCFWHLIFMQRMHLCRSFSAWILQHCQNILGFPSKVSYIEVGPGNGTLAKQILSALTMTHGGHILLKAMHIHMVGESPGLRAAQAEALHCRETYQVRSCCEALAKTRNDMSANRQMHKQSLQESGIVKTVGKATSTK